MKAFWSLLFTALAAPLLAISLLAGPAMAAPVLMISIDGMRAKDVVDAPARGLNLPNMRAFMTDGTYADGVRNVLPTITYPNHTTLVTGVWPSLHGIADNLVFDPLQKDNNANYYYSADIKVPTLWDAVHAKGGKVASLAWPVTVGNPSIDDNIPSYRSSATPDGRKLLNALSTPGLMARLEKATGIPFAATSSGENADSNRAKWAAALIGLDHPAFMTLHLTALDGAQHKYGPGTPEAKATLERLDGVIGTLVSAVRAAQPDTVIALVSDHGFAAIDKDVNLPAAFVDAGLATLDPVTHKVTAWEALPWFADGSEPIMLARPDDAALQARVLALLNKLAADPANGIAQVVDRTAIAKMGGSTEPSFWLDFTLGYEAGKALTGPLITPSVEKGNHGYFPTHPEMRSNFLIVGPGIAKGKALGEIDMRDIAPTLAKIMQVDFPSATGKPLF